MTMGPEGSRRLPSLRTMESGTGVALNAMATALSSAPSDAKTCGGPSASQACDGRRVSLPIHRNKLLCDGDQRERLELT